MKDLFLKAQKNEITEHHIYARLARKCKHPKNKRTLEKIAADEHSHYGVLKGITKREVKPKMGRVRWYVFLASILGLTFALKLMERGEELAQTLYKGAKNPALKHLWLDEQRHEKALIDLIQDEKIEYAGSIVLGLNDALVELSGALAGFTLALRETKLIALIGGITGFAASLSMAASGFLSSREEGSEEKNPLKSAIYTGVAYIIVVALLITPYILFNSVWLALSVMLTLTVLIIAGYTFYIAVAKELRFWKRFAEMAAISLGVAVISFGVGLLLRTVFGIDA